MKKEAPRRSVEELNGFLAEQGLEDGTTDPEVVRKQAKEGHYEAQAEQAITRFQLKQIPEMKSALDRLQPSLN